jgi:hypothetical protein
MPAVATPSTVPRRSLNQLVITSDAGTMVEPPRPMPSNTYQPNKWLNEVALLIPISETPASAAPSVITILTSTNLTSQPASGAAAPVNSTIAVAHRDIEA